MKRIATFGKFTRLNESQYKEIVVNQKTGKTIIVDADCEYLSANGRDCPYMYDCCNCGGHD